MRALSALVSVLLLAGCATPQRNDLVWIGVGGGADACRVDVEGQPFALPAEAERLRGHVRPLARRSQGAVIGAVDENTSFACWSTAILALQAVGFRRLGLVSAPQPD